MECMGEAAHGPMAEHCLLWVCQDAVRNRELQGQQHVW